MCIYVCILIWCIDLKTDSAPVDTRDPSSIFLNTVNEILLPQPKEKTQEHSRCCKSQHRNYLLIKAFHHVFSLDFIEACLTYLSKDNWPIFIRSGILSSSGAVTPTGLHPRFLEPKKSKGTLALVGYRNCFFINKALWRFWSSLLEFFSKITTCLAHFFLWLLSSFGIPTN